MPGCLFGAEPTLRRRLSRRSSVVASDTPNACIVSLLGMPQSTVPGTRSLKSCDQVLILGSFAQAQSPFLHAGEAKLFQGLGEPVLGVPRQFEGPGYTWSRRRACNLRAVCVVLA